MDTLTNHAMGYDFADMCIPPPDLSACSVVNVSLKYRIKL